MVSVLEWQQRLVEQFCLEGEGRVGKFYQHSLSLVHLKKIHSSNFLAASLTKKDGIFVSVPKKIFPKAVERNKIRRRIRAIVFGLGFKVSGFGIKFVIRKEFLDLDYKEAYNEVGSVIEKECL